LLCFNICVNNIFFCLFVEEFVKIFCQFLHDFFGQLPAVWSSLLISIIICMICSCRHFVIPSHPVTLYVINNLPNELPNVRRKKCYNRTTFYGMCFSWQPCFLLYILYLKHTDASVVFFLPLAGHINFQAFTYDILYMVNVMWCSFYVPIYYNGFYRVCICFWHTFIGNFHGDLSGGIALLNFSAI